MTRPDLSNLHVVFTGSLPENGDRVWNRWTLSDVSGPVALGAVYRKIKEEHSEWLETLLLERLAGSTAKAQEMLRKALGWSRMSPSDGVFLSDFLSYLTHCGKSDYDL